MFVRQFTLAGLLILTTTAAVSFAGWTNDAAPAPRPTLSPAQLAWLVAVCRNYRCGGS